MIAIPALDIREGKCVQLVGGSYAEERIRLDDPAEVALRWSALGFGVLHLVDLDAATGEGSNAAIIEQIIRDTPMRVQVGGGVRSGGRIAELLDAGAMRVVAGTRALEDQAWIERQASRFPGQIIVAADVRAGRLSVRGWRSALDRLPGDAFRALGELPLAGLLVTAVDVEGTEQGPAIDLIMEAVAASRVPVIAAGGIGTIEDLRAVERAGAGAAVIGMALYSGALEAGEVAKLFGAQAPL